MNPSQIGDISHVDYGLLVHSGERDSGRIEVASSNLAQSTKQTLAPPGARLD
jgi:hypothetical protein